MARFALPFAPHYLQGQAQTHAIVNLPSRPIPECLLSVVTERLHLTIQCLEKRCGSARCIGIDDSPRNITNRSRRLNFRLV